MILLRVYVSSEMKVAEKNVMRLAAVQHLRAAYGIKIKNWSKNKAASCKSNSVSKPHSAVSRLNSISIKRLTAPPPSPPLPTSPICSEVVVTHVSHCRSFCLAVCVIIHAISFLTKKQNPGTQKGKGHSLIA